MCRCSACQIRQTQAMEHHYYCRLLTLDLLPRFCLVSCLPLGPAELFKGYFSCAYPADRWVVSANVVIQFANFMWQSLGRLKFNSACDKSLRLKVYSTVSLVTVTGPNLPSLYIRVKIATSSGSIILYLLAYIFSYPGPGCCALLHWILFAERQIPVVINTADVTGGFRTPAT